MFGDDFLGGGIEELFNKLAGQSNSVEYSSVGPDGRRQTRKRMQRDVFGKALLDKVTTKKNIYFISCLEVMVQGRMLKCIEVRHHSLR